MSSNYYFSILLFVFLLVWGPLFNSQPYSLIIRISYLILIPVSTNYLILWLWKRFDVSKDFDRFFKRILSIIIGSFLIICAIYYSTIKFHHGNTSVIMTREGLEEVGDDIVIPGVNYGAIFICIFFAYFFFRDAFVKKK